MYGGWHFHTQRTPPSRWLKLCENPDVYGNSNKVIQTLICKMDLFIFLKSNGIKLIGSTNRVDRRREQFFHVAPKN